MPLLRNEMTMSRCVRVATCLLVVLVSVLALASQSGHASVVAAAPLSSYAFTVNTTADTHDAHRGDGMCADSNGLCSLRAAIEEADALPHGSSITITVPAGTYALTLGTLGLTANTITINGVGSTTTIIKGNHTFGIMSIGHKMAAHLSQLTIEGGSVNNGNGGGIMNRGRLSVSNSILSSNSATYNNGGGLGGGIYNTGTLTVSNSTLSKNSAGNYTGGGGIENIGTLTVSNSTFSNNSANLGNGGGIDNCCGTVTVTHSTFSGNSAGGFGFGGGIENSGTLSVSTSTLSGNSAYGNGGGGIGNFGTLAVSSSTLSGNSANSNGGGIFNGGTLTVTNSTLRGNEATYVGGGIDNNYGTLSVSTSTLSGNSANGVGGGIFNDSGTLTVSASTLSGNSATGDGGGIYNSYGMLSVSTSTFSGNLATNNGGGIVNYNRGMLSVSASTFSGNSATNGGGGIYNTGSTATLTGTIVANSLFSSNCAGTISEGVGYNLDSGSSCGFSLGSDLTNTDPMLGPLGHNGGPTQTMALLQGSKAIDWVAASSYPASDQRGYMRPDGSGESMCDIGAYESAY